MPEDATAHAIHDYLARQRHAMCELVEQLVRAESPSTEPESQAAVQAILREVLERVGFRVRRVPGRHSGGHLWAVPRQRSSGLQRQLMLGHGDTVWPVGTLESMPFKRDEHHIHGPGVYDMKAGLVQMVFALEALQALGMEPPLRPLIFINSDEEIGSPESARYIRRLSRLVQRVFVLEPSLGVTGKLKTQRKGVGRFEIVVYGKAAHAGLNPGEGASAILELSYLIQKLFALNDSERGITVNVGQIDGGLRSNVIAPESRALVDVRMLTREDARKVEAAIRGVTASTTGMRIVVEGRIGREPMEATARNRALWAAACETGRLLGLTLEEGVAGGGSDGNITSLCTATLDGLGAVGDGAHAAHEFVYIDRMVERAALLALLLMMPSIQETAAVSGESP